MAHRLAYLGPAGTFTEGAALRHAPQAELIPCPSISAVAEAVSNGKAEEGVVPIENSLEGSVNDTLDMLINEPSLFICGELVLPVQHCLLVRDGMNISDIKIIYSHPQALAQCRRYLETHFPGVAAAAALSTAAAAKRLSDSQEPAGAIGTIRAAELYKLDVLAHAIQDNPNNVTRFAVLAPSDREPTGNDRTSLCFSFTNDRPGLLYGVMKGFAERGINLAKIESRPTGESLGKYIFLIDLDGHREETPIREALQHLQEQASWFRIFGSYPRYRSIS